MAKAKSDKSVGTKRPKTVYNRATGKHQKPATQFDSMAWWKRKLGFGEKRGEGALAKRRKKVVDSNVKAAGG